MSESNLSKTRRAIAFLESKNLDSIDFTIEVGPGRLNLTIGHAKLTQPDVTNLKRHFGPFEIIDEYDAKGFRGQAKLDESFSIVLRINRVYACQTLNPKELTEEKFDEIKALAREGKIKLQDCKEVEPGVSVF